MYLHYNRLEICGPEEHFKVKNTPTLFNICLDNMLLTRKFPHKLKKTVQNILNLFLKNKIKIIFDVRA